MRKHVLLAVVVPAVLALAASSASAAFLGYDGITGAALGFTGSTPRTYMGQGFEVADPGTAPQITSMRVVLVTAAAVNYANTAIRVQFWDNYNSGASPVFSNAIGGPQVFTTGPLSNTGATAYTFTLNFASPIPLTGLTGHGVTVNWQSDAQGLGTFVDDTNLTTGLRTTGSANIPVGVNLNPGSGYYRNASGQTDFNFQSSDSRSLSGVTNGGLLFDLTLVPEPCTVILTIVGGLIVSRRRK